MNEKALEEFTEKKSREGISVSEALKNNDFKLIIELSRYQTKYIALNMYESLPDDVKCEVIDADGVAAEWYTNPNVVNEQVIFHLFGGGYVMGILETRRRLRRCCAVRRIERRILDPTLTHRKGPF